MVVLSSGVFINFLLHCFKVFIVDFSTSLARFFPGYFILIEDIMSGPAQMIFFSMCLLLVYRNATDFRMLTLCLTNLTKVFINSASFLVESLKSFKNKIISSEPVSNVSLWFLLQASALSSCFVFSG